MKKRSCPDKIKVTILFVGKKRFGITMTAKTEKYIAGMSTDDIMKDPRIKKYPIKGPKDVMTAMGMWAHIRTVDADSKEDAIKKIKEGKFYELREIFDHVVPLTSRLWTSIVSAEKSQADVVRKI